MRNEAPGVAASLAEPMIDIDFDIGAKKINIDIAGIKAQRSVAENATSRRPALQISDRNPSGYPLPSLRMMSGERNNRAITRNSPRGVT